MERERKREAEKRKMETEREVEMEKKRETGGISMEKYVLAEGKRQIKDGKSGAEVWETADGSVLKYVRRESLPDPEMFGQYRKEAYFYGFFRQDSRKRPSYLPEVWEVRCSDQEILIHMKKYQKLFIEEDNEELLGKIMRALAEIHVSEIPAFLRRKREQPGYLTKERIEECRAGWQSVLGEHPGVFDERILAEAEANINEIIGWHEEEEQVLTHGDFHRDNLLQGEKGEILVCDWQGVGQGGASGDISFFLSRLGADGINMDSDKAVALYCKEREGLTGKTVTAKNLRKHMQAANLITSFQFWHEYLHGSAPERVRDIYEKMVMD